MKKTIVESRKVENYNKKILQLNLPRQSETKEACISNFDRVTVNGGRERVQAENEAIQYKVDMMLLSGQDQTSMDFKLLLSIHAMNM